MNRLSSRLQKVESLIIPDGEDAFVVHVPPGEQHMLRRQQLMDAYSEKGCALWCDEGHCVPDRQLWQVVPADLLSDKELDAMIDSVQSKVAAREEAFA